MPLLNKKLLAYFWLFSFAVSFAVMSFSEARDRYFSDGMQFQPEVVSAPKAEKFGCTP